MLSSRLLNQHNVTARTALDNSMQNFDLQAWLQNQPWTKNLTADDLASVIRSSLALYNVVEPRLRDYVARNPPNKVHIERTFGKAYGTSNAEPHWRLQGTVDLALEYDDRVYVFDWKTFRGDSKKHVQYKAMSMQPNVYAEFWPNKQVSFYFYSVQVTTGEVVTVSREPKSMVFDLTSVAVQIELLKKFRQGWNFPTNTDSCFKYGRPCEFYADCAREPQQIPNESHQWPILIRQSNLADWYACPEKYRRGQVATAGQNSPDASSDESEYGRYVHEVMAALIMAFFVETEILITTS